MLRAFVFDRTSVLVRHWFEIDLGDSSMEHGARLELRLLDPQAHRGTESAAQRFVLDRPVWRADLFDKLAGAPGAFEAAHFHPVFDGVEPSKRVYLDVDPWTWLRGRLADISAVAAAGGVPPTAGIADDAADVRDHAEEIVAAAQALAPARCTSNTRCHRWTRDVAETVRLMMATTKRPDLLDLAHTAPWATA
jgi:hypothetical protein